MSEIKLNALKRESGRCAARDMRRIGTIPGIYYHKGEEPISISVKELDLRPLIYTAESHIVKLILDGEEDRTCIMKTYDFHPTTDRIVHFDLQGVSGDETVRVEVPVVLKGQSIGVKEGGKLEFIAHKLQIECLPANMPEHIAVDISTLQVGHSIHVSDLKLENIKITSSSKITIVTVVPPKDESAASTSNQPEVIIKGKAAKSK
jgi:large subunit ribosomal protein L25